MPTGHLTPFTSETAAAAGRKGGEARRAAKLVRSADVRKASAALDDVRMAFDRDELGPDAAAAASYVIGRVVAGSIPIRNGDEAATLLRALVDVARLEAGQPTSATAVLHVGSDAAARVLALRDQARRALGVAAPSSAALAADDPPGGEVPSVVDGGGRLD